MGPWDLPIYESTQIGFDCVVDIHLRRSRVNDIEWNLEFQRGPKNKIAMYSRNEKRRH